MLYEACGRIVNPIYGSVGLMWSGSWQLCQDAVEAVLKGAPITQIAADAADSKDVPPLKAFDIRHVTKEGDDLSGSGDLHRVRNRCRFKRAASKAKRSRARAGSPEESGNEEPSHGSSLSHQSGTAEPAPIPPPPQREESLGSAETPEPEADQEVSEREGGVEGIELDLTLGFEPIKRCLKPGKLNLGQAVDPGFCKMELGL